MKKKIIIISAALLVMATIANAWEPTKPITAIVGNTPGAGNEIAFRKLAEIVQKSNPKFVYVVQNIPGADSVIANNKVLEAMPDGYTINIPSHMSSFVTNDIWQASIKKYNYNSFIDVLTIGKSPLVLIAHSSSLINTPQEFIKHIKTTGASINIAVGGGAHRTAYEYLMEKGKGNRNLIRPVKFNGPQPAILSVASFDSKIGTEFGIVPLAVAKSLLDSGRIKAIGLTGNKKMKQYPNIPLLADAVPGINVYAAWSIQLPPGTAPDVVEWYRIQFSNAIRSKEYQDWAYSQVVFTEESELTPAGLRKHIEELRSLFIPVLITIDLSNDQ